MSPADFKNFFSLNDEIVCDLSWKVGRTMSKVMKFNFIHHLHHRIDQFLEFRNISHSHATKHVCGKNGEISTVEKSEKSTYPKTF